MEAPGGVQVQLELGHRAQVRRRATAEGFTHDWAVFVRGPGHTNIQHFVDKVVFHLHESFPKPRRVCKGPPYQVEESGYAGFILPIEVYFKNKEEPKKVRFDYDLFLHLEGHPPVNHLRCEKLTFNNPTEDFRRKLLRAGGQRDLHKPSSEEPNVMVMQEGSSSMFGQHMKLCSSTGFSTLTLCTEPRRGKGAPPSKDGSKGSTTSLVNPVTSSSSKNSSQPKLHKASKEHKDPKEAKSAFRDCGWEPSRASREAPRKPKDTQPASPKMAFKEPKSQSKDPRPEPKTPSKVSGPEGVAGTSTKRLSSADPSHRGTLKRRRVVGEWSDTQPSAVKLVKDRPHQGSSEEQQDGEETEPQRRHTRPLCQRPVSTEQSDGEEPLARSDCEQPSPTSSSSSSSNTQDLHSDTNESEDQDSDRPAHPRLTHHHRRVSLSDGSESDDSSAHSHKQATPPSVKPGHTQVLDVRSPTRQEKSRSLDCDQDYLEELVELHKRLMALREGHILQQVVNVIEETGHFHISSSTFDFDLCSLDRATVRKLQTHLDSSGRS